MKVKQCKGKGLLFILTLVIIAGVLIGMYGSYASANANPEPVPAYDVYHTPTSLSYDPNDTAAASYTPVTLTAGQGLYTINADGAYKISGGTAAAPLDDVAVLITNGAEVDLIISDLYIKNCPSGDKDIDFAMNTSVTETGGGSTAYSPLIIADHSKAWVTVENSNHLESANINETNINAGIAITVSSSLIFTERSTGSLDVIGGRCSAAIGGWHDTKSGFIMINGGTITALANKPNGYAAIGGGHYNSVDGSWCPGVVINGGDVTASGGHVGIGGWYGIATSVGSGYAQPYNGKKSFVEINGGTVYADNGGSDTMVGEGAAIGFVTDNDKTAVRITEESTVSNGTHIEALQMGYGAGIGGSATIEGGTIIVDMRGGTSRLSAINRSGIGTGAGVGGGGMNANRDRGGNYGTAAGDMLIAGGDITVYAYRFGAGIGGGGGVDAAGPGGNIDITGGNFKIYASEYGAGIGGGGTSANVAGGSGGSVVIDDGAFVIYGGRYGAGIGGGGSQDGVGGDGGSSVEINGGDFTVYTGSGYSNNYDPADAANWSMPSYGAGIGGGGSYNSHGGNGSSQFLATGGRFNSESKGYGAGIGGGGSHDGDGGTGGVATYEGGTVKVHSENGVGMGGGNSVSGQDNSDKGEVFVVGGNISTEITSTLPGVADTSQHAWTLPWTNNPSNAYPHKSTTEIAIRIETPDSEVGNEVSQVAFRFKDVNDTAAYYYNYGVNDTFVTPSASKGEVWLWVPADFNLHYDLTSGYDQIDVANGNDFKISEAYRKAVGYTYLTIDQTSSVYHYEGDEKNILTWDYDMSAAKDYGGTTWGTQATSSGLQYASLGLELYQLVGHNQDNGSDVVLVGWADAEVVDPATGNEHIFAVNDGWDYTQYAIDTVQFTNGDITVYAIWGYDMNGNGVADVLETNYRLSYDANGGTNAPANSTNYREGDSAPISTSSPVYPDNLFMGWTTDASFVGAVLGAGDSLPGAADIYIGGSGTIDYGNGYTVSGDTDITFGMGNITLYALWGKDANGNGVPDALEPARQLIHDGNGAASGVPANKFYVDGSTAVSDSGAGMTHTTSSNLFLGWTEDANVAGHVFVQGETALLPADVADPLTLSAPFSGSDMTIYAVWGADNNGNNIADVYEDTYHFIYETSTADTVDGVPADSNVYMENDSVDLGNNNLLDETNATTVGGMSTYMKRDGWVLLGWTPDHSVVTEWDEAAANAYFSANGVYPDDVSLYGSYNNFVSGAGTVYLTDINGMQFNTSDIEIYAVWGIDANGTGVPDWNDVYGRTVQYFPSLTGVDPSTVPFNSNGYVDNGNGNGYAYRESVAVSSLIPQADDFVFLGWSPVYIGGTEFGFDLGQQSLDDFYRLLCLLEDIPKKENYSLLNSVGNMIGTGNAVEFGGSDAVQYNLHPGFETFYNDVVGGASFTDAYGGFDWYNDFDGQGFLSAVTFDAFATNMDAMGDGTGADPSTLIYKLYGIWGADINHNGVADIFEDTYTLYYDNLGGVGGPGQKINNLPGRPVPLDRSSDPTKLDGNNNDMCFLGWTTEINVQDSYTAGERALVPQLASGVTFGNFDITVYAVWATDYNSNGIPDVYEDGFTLTYDANGGTGEPIDNTIYQYGDQVTVDTSTTPTHGSNYLFLYWTDDANVAAVYGRNDRASLPVKTTDVTFTSTDVTLYAVWGEDANGNNIPDVYEDDYSLKYDANGGSNAPRDDNIYVWGDTVTLDDGSGMLHGAYVFVGWTLADTATYSSVFTVGEAANLPALVTDVTFATINITANAVWSTDYNGNGIPDVNEESYTVTYDANGGTGSQTDGNSPYLTDTAVTILDENDMAKSGSTFLGWNTAADGSGTAYAVGDTFTISEDTVLYAQWSDGDVYYKVTYDANGGTGSQTDSNSPYLAGSTVTILDENDMAKSGSTFLGWNTAADGSGTAYAAGDTFTINGDTVLYAQWSDGDVYYKVTYDANGGTGSQTDGNSPYLAGSTVTILDENDMAKSGSLFLGWNTAADGSGTAYTAGDTFTISEDTVLYAQWKERPVFTDQHIHYVEGYPDGSVQPDGKITRAEAATIFFRLLDPTTHANKHDPVKQAFTDVSKGEWYAQAINYLASIGILKGYSDNTFKPNQCITRAEFAALVAQFDALSDSGTNVFIDVPDDHWAVTYINSAFVKGWVQGYPDGTFKPERCISRGETVSLVNAVLDRAIDDETLAKIKNPYFDITPLHWAYADMMEASIDHEYDRDVNGDEHWLPGTYKAELITDAETAGEEAEQEAEVDEEAIPDAETSETPSEVTEEEGEVPAI